MAVALVALMPTSAAGIACAVAGGALGGWICDVDVTERGPLEALRGVPLALASIAVCLGIDWWTGGGFLLEVVAVERERAAAGLVALLALCLLGSHTPHRSFTHSVLGIALFSLSVWLLCPPLVPAFALGMSSHAALDLLNGRRVKLLYPFGKGFCLGLCSSDGLVDRVLCSAGLVVSTAMVAWCLFGVLGLG